MARELVLIVEDKQENLELVRDLLQAHGYNTLETGTAEEGIVLAAERYDSSDPVNLGNGQEFQIRDLAAKIATAARYEGRFVWDTSKPNGQPRRRLDVSRARERVGFEARTPFEKGIAATIAYYEEHRREIETK